LNQSQNDGSISILQGQKKEEHDKTSIQEKMYLKKTFKDFFKKKTIPHTLLRG
jgi:hypothetical protein